MAVLRYINLSLIFVPSFGTFYLVPILSPLTVNEFTVRNSFSFSDENAKFDANCIMASLDIESLFIRYNQCKLYKGPFFLIMILLIILSKNILKNFSNLVRMSDFSHFKTHFIANYIVLPWDPR